MAKRGPKPKQKEAPIGLIDGIGDPPGDLSPEEAEAWQAVSRAIPFGIVRAIDAELLRRYCESIARLRRLKAAIAETLADDRGFATLVRLAQAEATAQLKMESELCFSPSSRNRVTAQAARTKAEDDFDAFLSRGARSKEKSLI